MVADKNRTRGARSSRHRALCGFALTGPTLASAMAVPTSLIFHLVRCLTWVDGGASLAGFFAGFL